MKNVAILSTLILLSGCSSIADSWKCTLMSGHEHVVFETKLNYDSEQMLAYMRKISSQESLMFATKDVEIGTINNHYTRKQMELCSRKTQVLVDNFEDENAFRVYVRAPKNPINGQTKKIITIFAELKASKNTAKE